MEFGEQLHSNISHPVLREWQQMDLEITTKHLMYPVFIMYVEVSDSGRLPAIIKGDTLIEGGQDLFLMLR